MSSSGGFAVPIGWTFPRLIAIADIWISGVDKHSHEGEVPVRLCNYVDVYKKGKIDNTIEFMEATALPREIERFQLHRGDILATKDSEDSNDIAVPALVVDELPGVICGYHLALIRPRQDKGIYSPFLFYLFSSKRFRAHFEAQAVGVTRYAISRSSFTECRIPLPPANQQRHIAAYLDEQTAKIDRLIDKRQQQIELLKEQRAALIQQAVTRGLNPNAPIKDSGIAWLGEVPEHWEIISLGKLAMFLQTGPFGSQLHAEEYVEGGIPIVNPAHMGSGKIVPNSNHTVDTETAKRLERHILREGDIVFARRGELGRCALVTENEVGWLCGSGSLLMRPKTPILNPGFLVTLFQLKAVKESLALRAVGSTMDNLNTSILAFTKLPLPPLTEQDEILEFIALKDKRFENLMQAYTRQIALLQEYRASLIHECVTGKRARTTDGENDDVSSRIPRIEGHGA